MARWTFVRHGETRANAERWLSGWVDVALTPRGVTQAVHAGEALAGRQYHQYFVSDLHRARQTAGRITAALDVPEDLWVIAPELRERTLGSWQGASLDALRAAGESRFLTAWKARAPGAESQFDLALRTVGFLAGCENLDTLVVAHGGVIRGLLGLLDGVSKDLIGKGKVANAQPIEREVPDGRWQEILAQLEADD